MIIKNKILNILKKIKIELAVGEFDIIIVCLTLCRITIPKIGHIDKVPREPDVMQPLNKAALPRHIRSRCDHIMELSWQKPIKMI